MDSSDEEDEKCPLCCETLDITDQNFFPCPCGYQICCYCWNHIKENLNKLCPACRAPYADDPHNFSPVDRDEIMKKRKEKKRRDRQERRERDKEREKEKEKLERRERTLSLTRPAVVAAAPAPAPFVDRSQLRNIRVVQRNLAYVLGLPPAMSSEETLRKGEYFGQYGKIVKVAVNRVPDTKTPTGQLGCCAYVTFAHKEDARACIQALDNFTLPNDGRIIRASFGTTKYCNTFLRYVPCNNSDCLFLHEVEDDTDGWTREEMVAWQTKLPGSTPGTVVVVGQGGPSGTGRRISNPIFPPPRFEEPVGGPARPANPPAPMSVTPNSSSTTTTNNKGRPAANPWQQQPALAAVTNTSGILQPTPAQAAALATSPAPSRPNPNLAPGKGHKGPPQPQQQQQQRNARGGGKGGGATPPPGIMPPSALSPLLSNPTKPGIPPPPGMLDMAGGGNGGGFPSLLPPSSLAGPPLDGSRSLLLDGGVLGDAGGGGGAGGGLLWQKGSGGSTTNSSASTGGSSSLFGGEDPLGGIGEMPLPGVRQEKLKETSPPGPKTIQPPPFLGGGGGNGNGGVGGLFSALWSGGSDSTSSAPGFPKAPGLETAEKMNGGAGGFQHGLFPFQLGGGSSGATATATTTAVPNNGTSSAAAHRGHHNGGGDPFFTSTESLARLLGLNLPETPSSLSAQASRAHAPPPASAAVPSSRYSFAKEEHGSSSSKMGGGGGGHHAHHHHHQQQQQQNRHHQCRQQQSAFATTGGLGGGGGGGDSSLQSGVAMLQQLLPNCSITFGGDSANEPPSSRGNAGGAGGGNRKGKGGMPQSIF